MLRTLLLAAAAGCAFAAAGCVFRWAIFDLDGIGMRDDAAGYGWLGLSLLSAGLVVDDIAAMTAPLRRKYHR